MAGWNRKENIVTLSVSTITRRNMLKAVRLTPRLMGLPDTLGTSRHFSGFPNQDLFAS